MRYLPILLILSGCISINENRRQVKDSYIQGLEKARKIAFYSRCQETVDLISGRIDVEEMKP